MTHRVAHDEPADGPPATRVRHLRRQTDRQTDDRQTDRQTTAAAAAAAASSNRARARARAAASRTHRAGRTRAHSRRRQISRHRWTRRTSDQASSFGRGGARDNGRRRAACTVVVNNKTRLVVGMGSMCTGPAGARNLQSQFDGDLECGTAKAIMDLAV